MKNLYRLSVFAVLDASSITAYDHVDYQATNHVSSHENVIFAPSDNLLFQNGQFFVHNGVMVTGTSAFVYHSPGPSFITSGACWYFDTNITLSIAPASFTDTDVLAPYTFLLPLTAVSLRASQAYGYNVTSVNLNPDGKFLAFGGYNSEEGYQQLEVYTADHANNTFPQALSTSVIFGNSAKGSPYDARLNVLLGAQINLFGNMNY